MLNPKQYMAPWEDLPYPNFIALVESVAERFPEDNALLFREGRQKEFTVWSFSRLAEEARRIARGLLDAGLAKGDRVILWAENRPEWIAVWLGAAVAGCVIVPVDFLTPEDECDSIISFTGAKAAFFSAQKAAFAKACASDDLSVSILFQSAEYERFGAARRPLPSADDIAGDDPCSIVFTSGTTGLAKGVTLTHKGIIANANAAVIMLEPTREQDVFINVLPLHHTYPTTCSFVSPLSLGISTIIVERLVGQVVIDDIRDARGTFLIAVPLLYDKMMAAINAKYQKLPFFVRAPLNLLRSVALSEAKRGNSGFGRTVFRFIRKKAGLATIRIMVAGGGALSPKTADFFDSFGFNIVHGYGMSENGPLISVNTERHKNNASVGLAVKYTEVRIAAQEDETKYLLPWQTGEIVVRSPSLMKGYFKNPEATAEMYTADGFLKTGDLGFMDKDGYIYISGRKKNLIVSAGGKNIYPEEIEARFSGSRVIAEILVVGRKTDDHREHIFAAAYPNYDALKETHGAKAEDDAFVHALIKKEIEAVNRKLPVYKKISDWTLRKTEFEKNAQRKIRRFLYKFYEEGVNSPI
jgi:long-chain acyl-CoA synthetase